MKILCIVQARMGSERLPGKVMKEILGKPMISYTLDRVSKSHYIDQVVLATSVKSSEDEMVSYLQEEGYHVFRGSEQNVLERYVEAARVFKGDIIIRVTGDCPLIDATIIDQVVTYFQSNCYDYVRLDVPDTFIRGFDVEIFSCDALERVYKATEGMEEDSPNKEHVTYYMYNHPDEFSVAVLKGSELYQKEYRLCVDTKEDYQLLCNIYEHFNDPYIAAKEVVNYLDTNPEVARLNQSIQQKHV